MAEQPQFRISSSSIYRDIIRDAYKAIISGGGGVESLYGILFHVLNVYVLRSELLKKEFVKLLRNVIQSRLQIDEAEAREVAEKVAETGDVTALVEAVKKILYKKRTEEEKVTQIELYELESEAQSLATKIIVEASETFLVDIGVLG